MTAVRYRRRRDGTTDLLAGDRKVGRLYRERHQSPRTNATGWRWYGDCAECEGLVGGVGQRSRWAAAEAVVLHFNEAHGTALEVRG